VRVAEPAPTLLAGTTAEWFWKSLHESDFHGGFGNRLFFLTGSPKPAIPAPEWPDPARLSSIEQALADLDRIRPGTEVSLDGGAREHWDAFYRGWRPRSRCPTRSPKAATKRTHTYALKLAMTYAALESTVPMITEAQVAAAIEVADYGRRCVEHLIQQRRPTSAQARCETGGRAPRRVAPPSAHRRSIQCGRGGPGSAGARGHGRGRPLRPHGPRQARV
jgi:hypothetical protein